MNELTPELMAEIATRLYNEIPGANSLPKTEAVAPSTCPDRLAGRPVSPLFVPKDRPCPS